MRFMFVFFAFVGNLLIPVTPLAAEDIIFHRDPLTSRVAEALDRIQKVDPYAKNLILPISQEMERRRKMDMDPKEKNHNHLELFVKSMEKLADKVEVVEKAIQRMEVELPGSLDDKTKRFSGLDREKARVALQQLSKQQKALGMENDPYINFLLDYAKRATASDEPGVNKTAADYLAQSQILLEYHETYRLYEKQLKPHGSSPNHKVNDR